MDDEKLIELVQNYEFLYNLSHPKYTDNAKREAAWNEISRVMMNTTARACRIRWQKLRDSYRRAYRKRMDNSEDQTTNKVKIWKYEKEISFLKEYFVERKSTSTNTAIIEDTNISEPKKMRYSEDGASSSTAATTETDLLEPRTSSADDLDQFFLSMSSTVKKFSPYMQAVVKNKIFTLVSEMEMKQLAPKQFQQRQEPTEIKCELPDEDFETNSFIEQQSSPESWTEEKYIINPS